MSVCGHPAHQHVSDCPTPWDLSDVDLDHPNFRAAFPDGKVPIRYLPERLFAEDTSASRTRDGQSWRWTSCANHTDHRSVLDVLIDMHEQLEALDDLNVNRICELADVIDLTQRSSAGRGTIAQMHERVAEIAGHVAELAHEGMTLRQIARLLHRTDAEVIDAAFGFSRRGPRSPETVARIMAADEHVHAEPKVSANALAKRYELPANLKLAGKVKSLRNERKLGA